MFSWIINMFIGTMPTWIWPAGAGGAVVIFFLAGILSHIPEAKPYTLLLKPVSFIVLILCVFMYGGAGVAEVYQEEIKIMKAKICKTNPKCMYDYVEYKCKNKPVSVDRVSGWSKEPVKECPVCGCIWMKDEKGIHIIKK